jgi:hypothetical protein
MNWWCSEVTPTYDNALPIILRDQLIGELLLRAVCFVAADRNSEMCLDALPMIDARPEPTYVPGVCFRGSATRVKQAVHD